MFFGIVCFLTYIFVSLRCFQFTYKCTYFFDNGLDDVMKITNKNLYEKNKKKFKPSWLKERTFKQ